MLVVLGEQDIALALELGDGVIARGVRRALAMAAQEGLGACDRAQGVQNGEKNER